MPGTLDSGEQSKHKCSEASNQSFDLQIILISASNIMVADAQQLALGLLQHSSIATRFVERAVVCGHWAMPNSMVLFDSGRNGTRVRLLDISIWADIYPRLSCHSAVNLCARSQTCPAAKNRFTRLSPTNTKFTNQERDRVVCAPMIWLSRVRNNFETSCSGQQSPMSRCILFS